jgi:HEAT repeat protein
LKAFIRELVGDFKAAARIGDPDSLEAVMDRVRTAPEDDLPASSLFQLGEALNSLPAGVLMPWLDDEDPGVRGIAAAAIGLSASSSGPVPEEVLRFIADDPVDEVRIALIDGLTASVASAAGLIERFLGDDSLRVRRTGLRLLGMTRDMAMRNLDTLATIDLEEDHGLREDLVEALNRLAEAGQVETVLGLLDTWAGREVPNTWVVTRVVSASWAQAHSTRCVTILNKLAQVVGDNRSIARALERHTAPPES